MWKPNASSLPYCLVVVIVLISSNKQVEIRSNGSRLCSLRNCEVFGVNIRKEFLKSFEIKCKQVIIHRILSKL